MKKVYRGFNKQAEAIGIVARVLLLGLLVAFALGFQTSKSSVAACETCLHPDPGSAICVACGDFNDWGGASYQECWPVQENCACYVWGYCQIAD